MHESENSHRNSPAILGSLWWRYCENKSCVLEDKKSRKSGEIWTRKTSSGLEGLSPQHMIWTGKNSIKEFKKIEELLREA